MKLKTGGFLPRVFEKHFTCLYLLEGEKKKEKKSTAKNEAAACRRSAQLSNKYREQGSSWPDCVQQVTEMTICGQGA